MEYRPLGLTGLKVSSLGFGASSLGGVFRPIHEDEAIRTVHIALDAGINFIDVSPFYGLTRAERVLGQALKGIRRDRFILGTKCGRYGHESKNFDFSAKRVASSIEESLQRLQVDHLDVLQAHDIEFGDLSQVINETIPAMRKARQAGKVRFIGVTGLPLNALRRIVESAKVDMVLSYCHYELNDTSLLELIPLLRERAIGVISASPLGMGLLTAGGPPAWHPALPLIKEMCANAAKHCASRGQSIERLAVQFAISNPDIASTFVGTADPAEMQSNIRAANEPIDRQLLAEVLDILKPVHNLTWPSGRTENN